MIAQYSAALAALSTLVSAGPVARAVAELDPTALAEAQQRDETATRAFSNAAIKTSDGKCLSVDQLSGDFRANLTPVQVAECGSTEGQGWDIITQGKHNDVAGSMLVVSTLTQACLNFDPRRAAGDQLLLFSCGGRADGGGAVTDSQLFAFDQGADTQTLTPANQKGSCLTVRGDTVDVAACDAGDAAQSFTFAGGNATPAAPTPSSLAKRSEACEPVTVTVTASGHAKRQDVIVTETLTEYVTVPPAAADATSFSSTTTVFVTVGDTPSAPAGGIPQVSINPTTTVTMNPGGGGGGAVQPAPTSAASSPVGSGAAPASSTKADKGAAPSAPAGGIPQISINPSTTVTMNPGDGGAQPTATAPAAGSSQADEPKKAPATTAPAAAPSAPAGGIPQISINPTSTATLGGGAGAGAGAQPTASTKKDAPAAPSSAPAASSAAPPAAAPSAPAPPAGGIPQISINPTTTVTMNPGDGGAQPTATAPAAGSSQADEPKKAPAAAPSAPAPPAGGIPQISINPTTTVTMNPGDGGAQPTATAPAAGNSQADEPKKAPATTAPAAAPPAGGIPQISINPSTTVTL